MLKLSEAIRLGAMLKPQCTDVLFNGVATCAYGAALDAIGALSDLELKGSWAGIVARWPISDVLAECPVRRAAASVWDVITDLNDEYGWTRERIADWVETIEQQQDAEVTQPVEAVEVA